MKICGKALPPRAALLLSFDFVMLVIVAPMIFVLPLITEEGHWPGSLFMAYLRLMVVGMLCQVIFYYHELYNLQIIRMRRGTLSQVLRAFGVLFLFLALVPLLVTVTAPVLLRTILFASIVGAITIVSRWWALPRHRDQVLIIGAGDDASELQEVICNSPEWNMEIAQIILPTSVGPMFQGRANPPESFDRLIVTNVKAQSQENLAILLDLKMAGKPIEDAQSFIERSTGRVRVDQLQPQDCIFTDLYTNRQAKRIMKRIFDVAIASMLLVATAPVICVTALVIWLKKDGPVFFSQERTGLFGRPFKIVKFRTMSPVAAGQTTGWAGAETNRITPLGRQLRKYRIDELPQLINVLKGEMSLIGPRPEQTHLCTVLEEHIPFYRHRHSVLPGLTGWAQVRYHYGSNIEESKRKVEYDLFYVKHLSVWLDCAIALETVKVILVGRGAV